MSQRLSVMCCLLLLPAVASAQSGLTAGIAGIVKDASGSVLPGVTVEASSPALIEKVRTTQTDGHGNFKIADLRPGVYTVSFTLAGFNTVTREGVELVTGFTGTVNADMTVGTISEQVVVTGATPIVDVQNVRGQAVLGRTILDELPTGKTIQGYASLIVSAVLPAASHDVGGNRGETVAAFGVHGGRGMKYLVNGMGYNMLNGAANSGATWLQVNHMSTQEVVLSTDGHSAEFEIGGVNINIIPKDGGNRYSVFSIVSGTSPDLQGDNLSDDLRARGLSSAAPIKYIYDAGVGLGGPIMRNKMWFYTGHRWWGAGQTFVGAVGGFFNKTQESWFYTPDPSRPTYRSQYQRDHNVNVTWQASPAHKITVLVDEQKGCSCFAELEGRSPEAARKEIYWPNGFEQVTWTHAQTNRLLFEAGISNKHATNGGPGGRQDGVTPETIGVIEMSNNLNYRAGVQGYGPWKSLMRTARFTASYVTGSHALKVGTTAWHGWWNQENEVNQDISYNFLNTVPQSVTVYAPFSNQMRLVPNLAVYAQDQWTISRLTLNAGVRFDWVRAYVKATHQQAGVYVPARDFPQVDNVPNWRDVTPRMGVAYDLFGNGKTALKASLGQYLGSVGSSIATANNPVTATVRSATRTWGDTNGDYIPQEIELGPLSNSQFGQSVITSRWSPDLLNGWGRRDYNWGAALAIQHELRPGVGLNIGYFRTWYGNFTATNNLAVEPTDFDPYCVTPPTDSRLPDGGGQPICGLYDIQPAKFGMVNSVVSQAEVYGKQTEVYNGVDVTIDARFGAGGRLTGGMNTGTTTTDNCEVLVDSPQKRFCRSTLPFEGQTQFKVSVVYPLPWALQVSGVYQNLAGLPILANYVARNAEIAPSLGRNLGQCGTRPTCNGTVTVPLIEPNTQFEDRLAHTDIRLTRTFQIGRTRIQGMFDIYNIFNQGAILAQSAVYGTSWLQPSQILGARLLKFGLQIDY